MKKRFFSLFTMLIMVISLIGVVPASAVCSGDIVNNGLGGIYINVRSAPYTTFANNGYNAYQRKGCGWFASARAYELTGKCKTTWNGVGWWNRAANYGYTKGQTARAKALVCWKGHVAVLEKIDGNTAYISEGGSGYGNATSGYTIIRTVSTSSLASMNSDFLGYVYLGVSGGGSTTTPIWGNNYMNLGSDFYAYIINTKPWKMITNDGDNVSLRKETGAANQVWHFKYQSNGYYKIINCKDNKALDVNGASSASGTNVQVYGSNTSDAQLWRIYGNNVAYYLKPKCSDCILDITGGYSADGTNVEIYTKNGGSNQIFSIYKLNTPGKSTISYSTKCSTVKFSWSKVSDANRYSLRIFKGTTDYKALWDLTTTSATVELPAGTYRVYVDSCNNYSYTKSNEITVTVTGNHNYTYTITKQPTCTSTGVKTYTCSVCKTTKTESIAKNGHNYITQIISPTCTSQGYTLHECSCGESYKDQFTSATGHKYQNGICQACGAKASYYKEPIVSTNTGFGTQNTSATQSVITNVTENAVKATKLAKVTNLYLKKGSKRTAKIAWRKVNGAKGYQVKWSVNKKFKKAKKKFTKKNCITLKRLNKNRYYIKVRAYKTVNGKKVYGKWSRVLKLYRR